MSVVVNYYDRIQNSTNITKAFLAVLMACLTGIMAQVIIPLPWTPVPITAEIFAVLIAGLLLGKKYGALSQILYILLGISIIPWFSGMTGGIDVFLGANGGYLIGFIFLSYFIQDVSKISTIKTTIVYFACIYIPGLIGLAIYSYFNQGILLSIPQLLIMGFIPFVIGDIVKLIVATSLAKLIKI